MNSKNFCRFVETFYLAVNFKLDLYSSIGTQRSVDWFLFLLLILYLYLSFVLKNIVSREFHLLWFVGFGW